MTSRKPVYQPRHWAAALLMVFALTWLTVSLPFVNEGYMQAQHLAAAADEESSGAGGALSSPTEEKGESGVTMLSEYLHDVHHTEHYTRFLSTWYHQHNCEAYRAHHPELFSPPPEQPLSV